MRLVTTQCIAPTIKVSIEPKNIVDKFELKPTRSTLDAQDVEYDSSAILDIEAYKRLAKPSFKFPNYDYQVLSKEFLLPDTAVKMSVVLHCQGKAPLNVQIDRGPSSAKGDALIVDDATAPSGLRFSLEDLPDFSLTP